MRYYVVVRAGEPVILRVVLYVRTVRKEDAIARWRTGCIRRLPTQREALLQLPKQK